MPVGLSDEPSGRDQGCGFDVVHIWPWLLRPDGWVGSGVEAQAVAALPAVPPQHAKDASRRQSGKEEGCLRGRAVCRSTDAQKRWRYARGLDGVKQNHGATNYWSGHAAKRIDRIEFDSWQEKNTRVWRASGPHHAAVSRKSKWTGPCRCGRSHFRTLPKISATILPFKRPTARA